MPQNVPQYGRSHKQSHGTPVASSGATIQGEIVSIYADYNHPLLQLKRVLPWEALYEIMTRHWRRAGKNTDGRPGFPGDVALCVRLVVLMGSWSLGVKRVIRYKPAATTSLPTQVR